MQYKWLIKKEAEADQLEKLRSAGLNISNTILNMLVQRGISTFREAESFFNPNLDELHDPYLMKDMDKAVDRLEMALNHDEKILVFGDYDVDGTTSVAMVYSFLKEIHQNIDFYIPDRYSEGYGVSMKGIDYAIENGVKLIIALDCGIKAIEKIAYANQNAIDFIICDHHNPDEMRLQYLILKGKTVIIRSKNFLVAELGLNYYKLYVSNVILVMIIYGNILICLLLVLHPTLSKLQVRIGFLPILE
jgi:single-stranded-DNA-specific exonuclease